MNSDKDEPQNTKASSQQNITADANSSNFKK